MNRIKLSANLSFASNRITQLNSQISIENIGLLHNKLLAGYLSRYPKITPQNYKAQLPIIIAYVGSELSKIALDDYYKIVVQKRAGSITSMFESYNFNPKMNTLLAWSEVAENLGKEEAISKGVITYLYNIAGIFFSGNNLRNSFLNFKRTVVLKSKMEEELIGGISNIAISSLQFWNRNTENPNQPGGIIQADAFGFLVGWSSAVYSELHDHGSLSESNSTYRLGQGVIGAIAGSSGGLFYPTAPPKEIHLFYEKQNLTNKF